MPPLVAEDCAEFTLHGTVEDRPWAMVLHMLMEPDIIVSRTGMLRDQATIMNNEWWDHLAPVCNGNTTLEGCRFLDLDSLSGPAGEVSTTSGTRPMPKSGGLSGDNIPPNVAALVTKVITGARGRRRGRIFFTGLAESQTTSRLMASGSLTTLQAAFNSFLSGINQNGGDVLGLGNGYDSRLVVIHTVDGVFSGRDDVETLQVSSRVATQRRRLRG